MKTLVIYVLHEINENVSFFIRHGLFEDPNADFWIVINDPLLKLEVPPYVHVLNRDNVGHDFGGYSAGLFHEDQYEKYDYFILINSTVRGPFLPVYYPDCNWISIFTRLITDEIKLGGTTIGCYYGSYHVQSMVLVTDRIGLEIGIQTDIFTRHPKDLPKEDLIMIKEIGYSENIIKSGYNIGCLLKAYQGVDFRTITKGPIIVCTFHNGQYCEMDIHPYEVVFYKIPYNPNSYGEKYTFITNKVATNKTPQRYDRRYATMPT